MKQEQGKMINERVNEMQDREIPETKIDKIADKVMTAVVATSIIQSGRSVASALSKNPWVVFGIGLATGYLAHKYRKEIITLSVQTAEQSNDFVRRQKQNLNNLVNAGESQPETKSTE